MNTFDKVIVFPELKEAIEFFMNKNLSEFGRNFKDLTQITTVSTTHLLSNYLMQCFLDFIATVTMKYCHIKEIRFVEFWLDCFIYFSWEFISFQT